MIVVVLSFILIIATSCAGAGGYNGQTDQDYIVGAVGYNNIFAWPYVEGQLLKVTYTHSVSLSPVTDIFEVTEDGFLLVASEFVTMGAGAPVAADFPGSVLRQVGDGFRLEGINLPFGRITVLTQELPNHRLVYGDEYVYLVELVGVGKSVLVQRH